MSSSGPTGVSQKRQRTSGKFTQKNSSSGAALRVLLPGNVEFLVGTVLPELLAAWFFYFLGHDSLHKKAHERLRMLEESGDKAPFVDMGFAKMLGSFVRHFGSFFLYTGIQDFNWGKLYNKAQITETTENNSLEGCLQTVIRHTELKLEILQDHWPAEKPFPKPSLVLGEDTHGEHLYAGFFFFLNFVLQIPNGGHLYFSTRKMRQKGELVAGSARKYLAVSPDSRVERVLTKLYTQLLAYFDESKTQVRKLTFLCPMVLGEERKLFFEHFPLFMPNEAIYTVHGLTYAVLDFWCSTEGQPPARGEGQEIYLNGVTVGVHDRSTPTELKIEVVVSTRFPGCLQHEFVFHFGEASDELYEETGSKLWFGHNLLSSPELPTTTEQSLARKLRKQSEQNQLSWVRPFVVLMASRFYFGFLHQEDEEEELVRSLQIRHMEDFRNGFVREEDIHVLGTEIGRRLQGAWDEGLERQKQAEASEHGRRPKETRETAPASSLALSFAQETIYEDKARGVEVWKARFSSQHFLQRGSAPDAFLQLLNRVEADLATRPVLANLEEARAQPDPSKPAWYAHTSSWGATRPKTMTLQPRLEEQGAARSGCPYSGQGTVGACWNEVDGFEELVAWVSHTFGCVFDMCHATLHQATDEKGKLPAISRRSYDESGFRHDEPTVCLSLGNTPMCLVCFEKPSARSSGARVAQTVLEPGSLCVMAGKTQTFLEHHVQPATEKEIRAYEQSGSPGAKKVDDKSQRRHLSLTFRVTNRK